MFIGMYTLVSIGTRPGHSVSHTATVRRLVGRIPASEVLVTHMKENTMPEIKMPEINTDFSKAAKDIADVAKDATYVVIGAGVLGFQQVQVQRQELLKRLADPKASIEDRVNSVRSDLSGALHNVDTTLVGLVERFEEIVERLETAVA